MIPVCRYGQTWAGWRKIAPGSDDGTERLTLEDGEWVTALTGQSYDSYGWTRYLDVTTSTGRRWQQGRQFDKRSDYSLRPSLALVGRLSHLSGRQTDEARVLCCHWTCD